jgi:dolichol kinase
MFCIPTEFSKEILRKTIHLSSLWIPIVYFFSSRAFMVTVLIAACLAVVALDLCRLTMPSCRQLISGMFDKIMRLHEREGKLSGASFMLIGALATVLLFPKEVAITALAVLMVSDTCASLVGMCFGKKQGSKTWQGSAAFIVSGWIVVALCGVLLELNVIAGTIAVIGGAVVEALSGKLRIDDNVTIPLAVGMIMSAIV